jgi:dTDP-glucose pyrophosphorylase/CBS domain-containing protein
MNPAKNLVRNLAGLLIAADGTIRDAMRAIEANSREMVLVCEPAGQIVGLVSDGDIRRALLAGKTMESPVAEIMTRDFFSVSPGEDRASTLDLMKARLFRYVPVLGRDRKLVAVHFLQDLIGAFPKPNIAVVMAGGKGTRLQAVSGKLPKPMVEIAGRPMLERLVLHLVGHGITTIYLAINHMAHVIENHFGDGRNFGCRIEYLREPRPLGTGGALSLLPERPKHPILVTNGDLVTRADITVMLDSHGRSGCLATMAIGTYETQIPFGAVTEHAGILTSIKEKPAISFLINRGIYVLEPEALDFVPKDEIFPITQLFEVLLEAKKKVGVFNFDDTWIDVGAPEDLLRARGLS